MNKLPGTPALRHNQRGLSLIELMVSMTISLVLLAGTVSILVNNSGAARSNDDLSRLQQNLRVASQLMTRDLRMAGYFGCPNNLSSVTNPFSVSDPGGLLDTASAMEGSESGSLWAPSGSSDITLDMVANTDAITVRFLEGSAGFDQQAAMTAKTDNIIIAGGNGLQAGSIAAIFDCATTDIFAIANADAGTSGSLSHANALSKIYSQGSVVRARFVRYFIGEGVNGPALFRQIFDETTNLTETQELVEGIENMQILWGVDNTGDKLPDTFLPANDPGINWNTVVSVRYALLGSTINDYGDAVDSKTYNVNGTDIIAPGTDRKVRRVLSNTILLRNFLRNSQS